MDDRRSEIKVVIVVFLMLSWIGVSLRCYTRIVVKANFGADDVFAICALVGSESSKHI
jgi:hypothetical protein